MLGAGRVANVLVAALLANGIEVVQIFSRTPEKGRRLARKAGAGYAATISAITLDADLYIVAIADDAIAELATRLRLPGRLVVHVSGTLGPEALEGVTDRAGVFWPVQTFAPGRRVNLKRVPVCIEASRPKDEDLLAGLAGLLAGEVHRFGTEERRVLHLAAVFSSNFTHFNYVLAADLCQRYGLPFSTLIPLIRQTAGNAGRKDLAGLQTGPAVRGDHRVLGLHRLLLKEHPAHREIYDLVSREIMLHFRKNGEL